MTLKIFQFERMRNILTELNLIVPQFPSYFDQKFRSKSFGEFIMRVSVSSGLQDRHRE